MFCVMQEAIGKLVCPKTLIKDTFVKYLISVLSLPLPQRVKTPMSSNFLPLVNVIAKVLYRLTGKTTLLNQCSTVLSTYLSKQFRNNWYKHVHNKCYYIISIALIKYRKCGVIFSTLYTLCHSSLLSHTMQGDSQLSLVTWPDLNLPIYISSLQFQGPKLLQWFIEL